MQVVKFHGTDPPAFAHARWSIFSFILHPGFNALPELMRRFVSARNSDITFHAHVHALEISEIVVNEASYG